MRLGTSTKFGLLALAASLAGACLAPAENSAEDNVPHHPSDFEWSTDKSGSLMAFSPSYLISDFAFGDAEALSAAELQAFFENTPYGTRSFLADYELDGELYADVLAAMAVKHQINPLVILATLQKETGLVSKTKTPSTALLNKAFGCGCPDGRDCNDAYKGMKAQTECAFKVLVTHRDRVLTEGETTSGWAPGETKHVLDGFAVLAGNRATAVLYTYTPWVLRNRGGNWLFWNVYTKYAEASGYEHGLMIPFHEGFIGGICTADSDCFYEDAICSDYVCTRSCTTTCPDRQGPGFVPTSCEPLMTGGSACVALAPSEP